MTDRRIGYRWRLREIMANRGMWATTDLAPLLEERGIHLSPAQVYRLVAQTPERLSLATLVALCDALGCTSVELIEAVTGDAQQVRPKRRAAVGSSDPEGLAAPLRPTRARITPDTSP